MTARRAIKTAAVVFTAVATLGVLAGCGTRTAGHASPQPSSAQPSSSSGPQVPNSGAPRVKNPLKTDAFRKQPCSVLTKPQLEKLDLHAKGKPDPHGGIASACDWHDEKGVTGGTYSIGFIRGGAGLSGPYSNRTGDFFKEIDPISGYPSVISMTGDHRSQGSCNIYVGLNDHQALGVGATMDPDAPNYDNPCGVAAKLAEKVVETVKGRQ